MRTWLRRAATDYERVSRGLPDTAAAATSASAPASFAAAAVATLARHYRIATALLPPHLACVVQPLAADAATHEFLASCRPDYCKSCLAALLRRLMSVTDTNGLLGRGGMFVLSEAHVAELLRPMVEDRVRRGAAARLDKLLDVGAGDGGVTAMLAHAFREVHCTEVSGAMLRRLAAAGYRAIAAPHLSREAFPEDGTYDVVALLNLLDRCDHPGQALAAARRLVKADGRVLLAVVLPFSEFVEEGTVKRAVHGPLPMAGARCGDGASFEASLAALLTRAVEPAGLVVERVARVPYLCRGDHRKAYYVLSDAIVVCRVGPPVPHAAAAVAVGPVAASVLTGVAAASGGSGAANAGSGSAAGHAPIAGAEHGCISRVVAVAGAQQAAANDVAAAASDALRAIV